MFFAIFWTAFIPFGMVILSLVVDWLKRSLRQARAHALASSNRQPIRRGPGQSRASNQYASPQLLTMAQAISRKRLVETQLICGWSGFTRTAQKFLVRPLSKRAHRSV
jgi:hypothetical protein